LSLWVHFNYKILITKYTMQLLSIFSINFYIVINTNNFFHAISNIFFEHATVWSLSSLVVQCHFMDSYVFLCAQLSFLFICLLELHHSYIFWWSHFYHLLYVHLQKIVPLTIFTKACPKLMWKPNLQQSMYNKEIKLYSKRKGKKKKEKNHLQTMGLKV